MSAKDVSPQFTERGLVAEMCLLVRDYISQLPFIHVTSSWQRNGCKSEGCHFLAKAAKKYMELLLGLFALSLVECRTHRGSKGWQNHLVEGAWVTQLPCEKNSSPTRNTHIEIWGFTCYRC